MKFESPEPSEIIAASLTLFGEKNLAVVSSFGAESIVLLHLIAQHSQDVPVFFIDTGKHFWETQTYRQQVTDVLGLRDVRVIRPSEIVLADKDPNGDLHKTDPDGCCAVRKVNPLIEVRGQFQAWFTGRKRYQAATRSKLQIFEFENEGAKINPLAGMTNEGVSQYMSQHDLPRHPMTLMGYPSIGCEPCTKPADASDPRAGRWSGFNKTECGIHSKPVSTETTV